MRVVLGGNGSSFSDQSLVLGETSFTLSDQGFVRSDQSLVRAKMNLCSRRAAPAPYFGVTLITVPFAKQCKPKRTHLRGSLLVAIPSNHRTGSSAAERDPRLARSEEHTSE